MLILSGIEIFALVFMLINRAEVLAKLKKFMEDSAATQDSRRNLLPIEKLLKCCGATAEWARTYVDEGLCDGSLKEQVWCRKVHLN